MIILDSKKRGRRLLKINIGRLRRFMKRMAKVKNFLDKTSTFQKKKTTTLKNSKMNCLLLLKQRTKKPEKQGRNQFVKRMKFKVNIKPFLIG